MNSRNRRAARRQRDLPRGVSPPCFRLLGIDYGKVRVGLAVSDLDQRIASPLATYLRRDCQQDARFFQDLVRDEDIGLVVIGLPMHTDGREGILAKQAREYGAWLKEVTALPVVFWDERFTTKEAEEHLRSAGLTRQKRKTRRDRVAAQLLLQAFIDDSARPL